MTTDEKDRLGDKLREVERGREDQYFAQRDRELLNKMRDAKQEEQEQTIREAAKMRCPKCGERLVGRKLRGIAIEECPTCGGMWLDRGELKELSERENEGWIARWFQGDRD